MADYKEDLNLRYWEYQKSQFSNGQRFFERTNPQKSRPPVFNVDESWRNVITRPGESQEEIDVLIALVPEGERHKWFRSMNSSQALTQSIFGNLARFNGLQILSELKDDAGLDLFGKAQITSKNFALEYRINYLGERHPTSLDGYVSGDYRITIECKFTEAEIGTCSRPRLTLGHSNHDNDYCDGSYTIQRSRKERCSLTESGVLYWGYVPALFKWKNDRDLNPCPLNQNYQLVRNILAAGIKPDGTVSLTDGHAILIYDERNPAFQKDGNGLMVYKETRKALLEPAMLRKCSWQRIVQHIRKKEMLVWLTDNLSLKYGL